MLKWLSSVQWYVAPNDAAAMGATHYARMHGIIPGYVGGTDGPAPLWISRSDALNPIEDVLSFMWFMACRATGREPEWMLKVGREIAPAALD